MKGWIALMLATAALSGAEVEGERAGSVRVVTVDPTPEPNEVGTHIVFPKEGEVKDSNPLTLQFRLNGYPLGFYSEFPRTREIRNSKEGQALHILIDDRPYLEVNEAIDDVGDSEDITYDQTITSRVPFNLSPGVHVLRVYPVRSFGESLKGDGCFAASYFYMGKEKGSVDLSKPFLTYNQPVGSFELGKPVLLDFYISNCQLSKDGYKVRLTIDGSDKRLLTQWVPYYIYGLKHGTHIIQLDLLDQSGNILAPLFKDTERTITVH